MSHPKMGAKTGQREILRGIEDGRSAPALVGGKPGGHDAAVAGKHRRLGQSGENAEQKDGGEDRAGLQVSRPAGEKREDRPENDADAVDALRSESVEQPACRQLAQRIRPAEAEEQIAHARGVQVQIPGHRGGGLGQRRAVGIAEATHREENADDEIADVGGFFGFGQCVASIPPSLSRSELDLWIFSSR